MLVRLLGPPRIEGPDGVLTGPATHRHRLALIALLTAAPGHVLARDKLIGLLWPETESAAARQLLSVSVHELRRALGDRVLLSEGETLRLDVARIRIDTIEFEAALSRGDPGSAVQLRFGPYLDGFALPAAVDFEQWVDLERHRLERLFHSALEQLAERAGDSGDSIQAANWWRRRLACTPSDGRVVLQLMRALAAAGDRAGALRCETG